MRDPPLAVVANRVVYARGFIACDPDEIFRGVAVTVEQGETTGEGRTMDICTEEQEWTAVVSAREGGTFESGPATACAVATTRRGGITDTFKWCGTPLLVAE